MRDLMTIKHTELILHYPRLYEKAHGYAPAQDQIDHFYNAPLDGKEATMNSLRRRVERKEAELKKITAAIEETEAKPFLTEIPELNPEEERVAELGRLRRQVERLKDMNASLVRRAEKAEATVQRLREVLR